MIKLDSVNLLVTDCTWASRKSNFPTLSVTQFSVYLNAPARNKFFPDYNYDSRLYYGVAKIKGTYFLLVSETKTKGFYPNADIKRGGITWISGVKNLRKALGLSAGHQRRFELGKAQETDTAGVTAYKLKEFKEDSVNSVNL